MKKKTVSAKARDDEAEDLAWDICIDQDLDLEGLEHTIEEYEAHAAAFQGLTQEQEADFEKFLAEIGAVYDEETDTIEFITKQ